MKAFRIQTFVTILTCLTTFSASSQTYSFAQSSAAYQELGTADYVIPDTSPYFGNIQLKVDFNFSAFNKSYDILNQGASVVIKGGYFFVINSTRSATIYMFETDLEARQGAGQVSEFSYLLSGTAGDKLLQLQWKNMGFEFGDSADFINFQIWLYEATGKIEVHFGPGSVKTAAYNGSSGPVIGLLEMNASFSHIYEEMYLVNSASAPTVQTSAIGPLSGTPPDGTVFSFTPGFGVGISRNAFSESITAGFNAGRLHINCEGITASARGEIYSSDGRLLATIVIEPGNNPDITENLPPGVYLLRVLAGKQVMSRRLLNAGM